MSVLIVHNDLDGVSAAILCKLFGGFDSILFWPKRYVNVPAVEKYKNIVFVDLSPPVNFVCDLLIMGKEVIIYDHHRSSRVFLFSGFVSPKSVIDRTKSGSRLFYENFYHSKPLNSTLNEYLELVDIYDVYKPSNPKFGSAENLSYLFDSFVDIYDYDLAKVERNIWMFIDRILFRICNNSELMYTEDDIKRIDFMKKYKQSLINKSMSEIKKFTDTGKRNYCVVFGDYKWEIADQIRRNHNKIEYAFIVSRGNCLNVISFRKKLPLTRLNLWKSESPKITSSIVTEKLINEIITGEKRNFFYPEKRNVSTYYI